MSTKIHQLVDGQGRPLVIALTHGQAGDSPTLKPLLSHEAYSSRAIRAELRSRRVKAVIPQPSSDPQICVSLIEASSLGQSVRLRRASA